MKAALIIAAAGSSERMGGAGKKQYMKLGGGTVLEASVNAFAPFNEISQIIVVCPEGDEDYVRNLVGTDAVVTAGGKERQLSVANAIAHLNEDITHILVHDAARPFVSFDVIKAVIDELKKGSRAVVPGVRPKNTIRTLARTLDRNTLFEVQTPQGFERKAFEDAYKKALADGFAATDDASVLEHSGEAVSIAAGDYANIKITTKEDIRKLQRTGTGYDVHRLVSGRKLMLGCVEIPFEKGLLGHSDADVLSHAIADALLGAAAKGDIGKIFPDNDPKTEGMPGRDILSAVAKILKDSGFSIVNIDATLIAQAPKISPYTEKMRMEIASALGMTIDRVSIKATTEEGLGFTGDGSAMSAQAVCSIEG